MANRGGVSSREASVLEKYFSVLCSAINDPMALAKELYDEDVLTSKPSSLGLGEAEEGRESPTSKRHQAAVKLLTNVDMALARDATVLQSLIHVLKDCLNDNGIAAESVRALEIEYSSQGEEYVSIQHARMVLVKHMNNIASVMTDVPRVSRELANRNIVSDKVVREIQALLPSSINPYANQNPKIENAARILLNEIQVNVMNHPGKFAVLIGVLKDNPATDQNVIALMEAEYYRT